MAAARRFEFANFDTLSRDRLERESALAHQISLKMDDPRDLD